MVDAGNEMVSVKSGEGVYKLLANLLQVVERLQLVNLFNVIELLFPAKIKLTLEISIQILQN